MGHRPKTSTWSKSDQHYLRQPTSMTAARISQSGQFRTRASQQIRGRDASYLAPPAQIRTGGFPACGSHLGSTAAVAVCEPTPMSRLSGSEPGTCLIGPHSPWSLPFAPPTPLRIAPLPHPMQSLCTLRNHCRQWPRNTRYQADATPYLGRTLTGWIAPACGWRTPRQQRAALCDDEATEALGRS